MRDKDTRFRLRVDLSPAEVRAFEWSRQGRPAPSTVRAAGNVRLSEVRRHVQRQLNDAVCRTVNEYLDALADEVGVRDVH